MDMVSRGRISPPGGALGPLPLRGYRGLSRCYTIARNYQFFHSVATPCRPRRITRKSGKAVKSPPEQWAKRLFGAIVLIVRIRIWPWLETGAGGACVQDEAFRVFLAPNLFSIPD